MSGLCGFVQQINTDQVKVLYEFNIDPDVITVAEACMFSNSTGELTELFKTGDTNSDDLK